MTLTAIPDPNDVVAGWGPLIGLILLFVVGVGIFFALRAQLRRVDRADLPSIHDEEAGAEPQEDGEDTPVTNLAAPEHVDIRKPQD